MKNQNGYATMIVMILIPIVFMTIGLTSFCLIKTRHNSEIKQSCQVQMHNYFDSIRSEINFVETLKPMAIALYQTQILLAPLVWMPSILKLYLSIMKLRRKMDAIQTAFISTSNQFNSVQSVQTFLNIQSRFSILARSSKQVMDQKGRLTFKVQPQLQVTKLLNILFPPYQRSDRLSTQQRFSIQIENKINPLSWLTFFKIGNLEEAYICEATLQTDQSSKLIIRYQI